ncbi:class I SAM-dependent methyltransferase [Streptomyces sp. NPDC017435]|uniref:class I SAM-dependent methyltransferase n=1 Tax=Streptomyces sp. NPDC017435 TaxID=3364995 RepID=UPI003791ABB2
MLVRQDCLDYRDFVREHQSYVYPMLASHLSRIHRGRLKRVLDAGVGPGNLSVECVALLDVETVGIDVNPVMLELAAAHAAADPHAAGRVELVLADAHQLTFDDASFDAVVSYSCFHHWARPETALRELMRVLRPGGTLLVIDTDRDGRAAMSARTRRMEPRFARFVTEAFDESWTIAAVRDLAGRAALPGVSVTAFGFTEEDLVGALDRLVDVRFGSALDKGDDGPAVAWRLWGRKPS